MNASHFEPTSEIPRSPGGGRAPLRVAVPLLAVAGMTAALVGGSAGSQERPEDAALAVASAASGGSSIFHETMVDMTWPEVEAAAEEGAVVLLPTGVIEEHGPHMSCGIDAYGAYLTCKLVRRELEARGVRALIAPPFYWGINRTTHVFPGTFTVRDETMRALLHDILSSLKSWGFTRVVVVNGHYDGQHLATLFRSVLEARETLGLDASCALGRDELERFRMKGDEPFVLAYESPPEEEELTQVLDIHAGAYETGFVAAVFPDQVDVELARELEPTELTVRDLGGWVADARKTTPGGYLGDPASFDTGWVAASLQARCRAIADAID